MLKSGKLKYPDKATRIWREIHVHEELAMGARGQINKKFRNGDYDNDKFGQGGIAYLRTALSELIASKDAEIERLEGELAALRAEIERLKASQLVIRKVEPAPFQFDEAAERTPADPVFDAIKSATEAAIEEVGIEGVRAMSMFPSSKTDTAPVVEVTQDDIEAAKESIFYECGNQHVKADIQMSYARHRTEAEARGRREALASVRAYVEDQYNQYLYRGYLVEEIDRLMTEVK